jgi:uncharacterized protein YyaL (SSP411 family)
MPNALAHEKSPYLLQHANNPVDWLPWGEAAFAEARAEQKPIFLSIGYSTCHWCHVMAHESFENDAIAAVLNAHFVCVKVDREERPDVDRVYMAYVQAMTGQGGWPLSAWLTPELKPFFGGTYFPPEDRHGRAGFPTILRALVRGWREEREKLVAEGERAIRVLQEHHNGRREQGEGRKGATDEPSLVMAAGQAFEKGFAHFFESFDAANGGFGGAPKFPRAANLNFLFRVAALQGAGSALGAEAVRLATATLRAMAQGGIHDHLGGGYHRYSVDEGWFMPHFEKMLYDQAQIAINCLEARQATGDERFAWMARDIFDYVARDLTSPAGAFYTAEDADSLITGGQTEHAEGAFYVWTAAELREELGGDYELFAAHFGVEETGNVPARLDPQGEFRGRNILVQRRPLVETAQRFALTSEQANDRLLAMRERLRGVRAARPRPQLDDKIVTANNALMISALARAHRVLRDGAYLAAAKRAADFIARELYDPLAGVLYRGCRNPSSGLRAGGRGATEGFAEDYSYLVQALLDLYEACFEVRWLQWAERLQAKMDELFWDDAPVRQAQGGRGGYFNSVAGDPNLVLRLKEDYDGAEPAPSSVAAMNLLRLAAMLGDGEAGGEKGEGRREKDEGAGYRERGVRCIEAFRVQWSRAAHGLPQMLCALELAIEPPRHVVLAGEPQADDFQALAAVLAERIEPYRAVLAADGGEGQRWLAARAPWLEEMQPIAGRATAYVCEGLACQAPVNEVGKLRLLLGR